MKNKEIERGERMASSEPPDHERVIEVGWVLCGRMDQADIEAAQAARRAMRERMTAWFPQFEWKMPLVKRDEATQGAREEPTVLLDCGADERELRHWDFALVVTGVDLESHYKPYALGVPSRSLSVAVVSTFRIDPQATEDTPSERRSEVMGQRIFALAMHLFGHLNGLSHQEAPTDFMHPPEVVADLNEMGDLSAAQKSDLVDALLAVADLRLEEQVEAKEASSSAVAFYLRGIWISRAEIWSTVCQAKPWEFPFRLSGLTTAAVSTLVVLLVTAEAWDLGMSRSPELVVVLSLLALLGTSFYVLKRQRLLLRRGLHRLSEQTVVTNVSIIIVVCLGMLTTYGLLFLITLLTNQMVFGNKLIETWAPSLGGQIRLGNHLVMAAFVASVGIVIGALGSSFEANVYFRHIAYADEET